MTQEALTCRELIAFLMEYLDGELPAEESRSFDHHLAICDECRAYVESYQETVRMAVAVCRDADGGVPEDVPEDLVAAVLKARAS